MRRRALVVTVFLALIGFIVTILSARFDVNRYHSRVQAEMENQLGRKVKFGDLKLRLFPPRLCVKDPVVWEDPNFGSRAAFMKADSMFLSLRLLPMLANKFEVAGADWQQPKLELVKNERGEWNFMSLRLSKLSSLVLRNGQVVLTKLTEKQNRALYVSTLPLRTSFGESHSPLTRWLALRTIRTEEFDCGARAALYPEPIY
jgi:hypothetical protein